MGSRHMIYPSPRGVHVQEYSIDDNYDPYRRPRRSRHSRSVRQSPRNVDWVSSPEPIPQTPYGPSTSWLSPQVLSSPAYRQSSSPAPTVGEHMALDDSAFTLDDFVEPYSYRPQPQRSRKGLFKSLWNGLKKLSGYHPASYFPRPSSYESQVMEVPAPRLSEMTQYGNPTPPGTEDATPYASPYARPVHLGGSVVSGSMRASPVPSMQVPPPISIGGSPVPVPSLDASPYVRPTNFGATPAVIPGSLRTSPTSMPTPSMPNTSPYIRPSNVGATPAVIPGSLRASPAPVPSIDILPAITVVSPSIPPSPHPSSIRSVRVAGVPRNHSEFGVPPAEEGSQTLHEHVHVLSPLNISRPGDGPKIHTTLAFDEPSSPNSSLASTVARFRRFVANLDHLPWVSDEQIADEYVPGQNPRSRLRRRVRQGAEPSWYNPRPEIVERPAYMSEWDMWAMQSTAALWDEMGGRARGYAPAIP